MENRPIIKKEQVETVYDSRFIKVFDLQYEPGKHYFDATRRSVENLAAVKNDEEFKQMLPDAVSCVVILNVKDQEPRLCLSREYRYPAGQFLLSVPAGLLDSEDAAQEKPVFHAAIRELQEETGYHTDHVELLTSIYTTVAFCNEKIDIYLALDLKDRGSQHLDEDEFINVEAYSVEELKQMIYDCKIQDAKTICGILTYASKYLSK